MSYKEIVNNPLDAGFHTIGQWIGYTLLGILLVASFPLWGPIWLVGYLRIKWFGPPIKEINDDPDYGW